MKNMVERNCAERPERGVSSRQAAGTIRFAVDRSPSVDPADLILEGILAVVPAVQWSFGVVEPSGSVRMRAASHPDANDAVRLTGELVRQRVGVACNALVRTTVSPLRGFAYGVTLVFAQGRAIHGVLTLLRSADQGPFTAGEYRMLSFGCDAMSEHLGAQRFAAPAVVDRSLHDRTSMNADVEPAEGAFYVLDADLRIVLAWSPEDECTRLPPVIEASVRQMTQAWSSGPVHGVGVVRPVPFLVVRAHPLSGSAGMFVGVRIDRYHAPKSLTGAATRFRISPREAQVLALLLDGNNLDEIAAQLCIAASTVQDHIKNMLEKTESTNRSELIARVLGWESGRRAQRA